MDRGGLEPSRRRGRGERRARRRSRCIRATADARGPRRGRTSFGRVSTTASPRRHERRCPGCLRRSLLVELSNLSAPAIYELFDEARGRSGVGYDQFVSDMKADGFRRLFDDKPVLLRLMASLTRQWIEASRELITRLDADLPAIRRDLLVTDRSCPVTRSTVTCPIPTTSAARVRIIGFEDGSRIVYKPKDCVSKRLGTR